jgi:translation initiation factor 1A
MVKNLKGGSGHKSQARKFASTGASKQGSKLRVIEEEGEIYAQITKMFGNGMCDALCIDEVTRLCIIRGKFRGGKGKRNSFVTVGTLVLVGIRDWETDSDKCDLLEVYNQTEVDQLKQTDGLGKHAK